MDQVPEFTHRVMRKSATSVLPMAGGFAVLHCRFPVSYEHNCRVIGGPPDPELTISEADRVVGDAGLRHRFIEVEVDNLDPLWAAPFLDLGDMAARAVVMQFARPSQRLAPILAPHSGRP
jgi:hypothetical protein